MHETADKSVRLFEGGWQNAAASDKQVENNSGRARGSKSNLEALPTSYFLPPQADITYSVTEFLPGAPDKKAFAMPEDVKARCSPPLSIATTVSLACLCSI